jgi:hypothetical protein
LDWDTISPARPILTEFEHPTSTTPSACQMAVGFVIFDAVCFGFGAYGLRGAVTAPTIEAMYVAAGTSATTIQSIIAQMSSGSNWEKAKGLFDILKTIWNGGSLSAVVGAFVGSLTWWDMILYGISGVATIVALVATDGAAFIAQTVIALASFGFVASDSVKAVQACGISPTPTSIDGQRYGDSSTNKIYLGLDNVLRQIPDPVTYKNLFIDYQRIITIPSIDNQPVGNPITEGAMLVTNGQDGNVYLLVEGGKRLISSPAVFQKFYFSTTATKVMDPSTLAGIPNLDSIN